MYYNVHACPFGNKKVHLNMQVATLK